MQLLATGILYILVLVLEFRLALLACRHNCRESVCILVWPAPFKYDLRFQCKYLYVGIVFSLGLTSRYAMGFRRKRLGRLSGCHLSMPVGEYRMIDDLQDDHPVKSFK